MNYVDSNLTPGEQVVHRAHLHWGIYLPGAILALLGRDWAPVILIGAVLVLLAGVRQRTTEMAVTNKRVFVKTGLLSRKTLELYLSQIENVAVNQGVFGRMLDFGTITVAGTGGTREKLQTVRDPLALRRAVHHASEQSLGHARAT